MQSLSDTISRFPRLRCALTPTPIHRLASLSDMLGIAVYCKRDDVNGFGFGGNKVRKLEFLVREALDAGCDSLITCGSNQSNWCRMTAAVASATGLEAHLVLGGGVPASRTGNLVLDELLGARLHHLDTNEDAELEAAAEALANALQAQGRRPCRIVMGGSNGLGTLGYMEAMHEILEQQRLMDVRFDTIVHATGSGGTQAGLIAGKEIGAWQGRIIGVSVSRQAPQQEAKVRSVLEKASKLVGEDFSSAAIVVNDEYVGAGYRRNTAEAEAAIEVFARREGIFLDHVYTGKAAAGLIGMAQAGRFSGENVLFVHTGGTAQLFE